MNEIRFLCPRCEQHIRCDAAHAGRKTSCPTCGATIRIPQSGSGSGALLRAEPVRAPGKTQLIKLSRPEPRPTSKARGGSGAAPNVAKPTPAVSAGKPRAAKPASKTPTAPKSSVGDETTAPTTERYSDVPRPAPTAVPTPSDRTHPLPIPTVTVKCVCPSCRAGLELKIPAGAVGNEITALAEVVSPSHTARLAESGTSAIGTDAQEPSTPAPPTEAQEPTDEPASAAAKAQSALSSTSMKPRMSYVLTGEPPAPKPGALPTSAGSVAQQKRGGKRR